MDPTPWHVPRDELLTGLAPLSPVEVPAEQAVGLVAAADAEAAAPLPRAAVAAMDGVVVAAASTPGALRLVGEVAAGAAPPRFIAGDALHIATGAVLPPGADAVVRRERCEESDGEVAVPGVTAGTDVRPLGAELEVGEVVVRRGDVVTPAHLALLRAGEVTRLRVHPRPRVALVITGEEVAPTQVATSHQVPDVNGPVLAARVRQLGAVDVALAHVGDDPAALREALRQAVAEADLVVATGGTSVGRHDHVAGALAAVGSATAWRLALRPAKPLVTGDIGGVPVLGLPGNPNAARVSFELVVRPVLQRLAGRSPDDGWLEAPLAAAVERSGDGRTHVLAGRLRTGEAVPLGPADLRHLAQADVLLLAPDGGSLPAGSRVRALRL